MNCHEARAGLWPPERPRLAADLVVIAREHVRTCTACGAYFAQDRALLDLYDRARAVRVPDQLRERVFDALAQVRSSDRTHSIVPRIASMRLGIGPAAGAMLLIVALALMSRGPSSASVSAPSVFVEDHMRRAVGEDHLETGDPIQVTHFLQRELGVRFEPIRHPHLEVTRVEICLLDGRRGAMIVYKNSGVQVAHYLVPIDDAIARPPAISEHRPGEAGRAMPVVTWATPRIEQALVGEVDREQLLELAAAAISAN